MWIWLHDLAHRVLIKPIELGAWGRNNASWFHGGMSPEGSNGVGRVVSWNFDIGVGAGLVIGKLDCHSLCSCHSTGQDAQGERKATEELHFGIRITELELLMKVIGMRKVDVEWMTRIF
jgi:hypothetical protein